MQAFLSLIRWNKPIGSLLLLWPTYWGLWLAAEGFPGWHLFTLFTLGTVVMRSAGCIINDLADRKWDGQVARTQHRPLVSGQITAHKAWVGFGILLSAALAIVWQMNPLTRMLAVLAALLVMLYPLMKRYTYYPQVVLGMAWSFGPLMAFTAVTNTLSPQALLVYITVVFWTIAFDTYYALSDLEDDRKIGVKSPAVHLGNKTPYFILFCHCVVFTLLFVIGQVFKLGLYTSVSEYVALFWVLYHFFQINRAMRQDPIKVMSTKAFHAFHQMHWVSFVLFVGIGLDLSFNELKAF